jgi:prevent-host-death family protein
METDHVRLVEDATIGAGDFKATCLKALDDVARTRRPLVITKRGKPIATLVPMPPAVTLFGALAGSVLRADDIESPIDVVWHADT